MELFLNWFFVIALFLPIFATVFFNRKHTAIRLQSHCGKVAITLMLVLQLSFLQSQHISGCKHTVKDVAITCIVTRLQPHQANTNLVAI
jgi:predicted Na+-dependent transporter